MTSQAMTYSGRHSLIHPNLPRDISGLERNIPHGPLVVPVLGAAASTAIAVATTTIAATAALSYFLVSAALGVAMVLLAPKPEKMADSGYQVNAVGGSYDHAIIYGEEVVAGPVAYDEVTDGNKYLHRIIAVAGHECESIEEFYFDEEPLTLDVDGFIQTPDKWKDKARIKYHLGDQTTADADLVAESDGLWTDTHIGYGICYVYVRFEFDRDAFPRGVPKITQRVKGKKVYDPRTTNTVWSDNSALCARDYLGADYGVGVAASKLNDAAAIVAADICEEQILLSDDSHESRYTTNGTFTTGSSKRTVMTNLHTAMAGVPVYGQEDWKSLAGAYTASVKSLNEDDMRGPIRATPRHPIANNFNSVAGLFRGAITNYKPTDYPPIGSTLFLAEDNDVEKQGSLDLPFTNSAPMAQRLAKIALYRHREQITAQVVFGLAAWEIEVGETIEYTYSRWGGMPRNLR